MSKPGNAFTKPQDQPNVDGFDVHDWIRGAALVTRSVPVCGKPHLLGKIEALKDEIERLQAAEFDDDRPLAKSPALAVAQQLEAARAEMLASMLTFTFRGTRPGEVERIKAAAGEVDESQETGEIDYRLLEALCISPRGLTWQDFRTLHVGDEETGVEGLGNYFMNTIMRCANAAIEGRGVDVPFSPASSALIARSSKS